MRAYAHRVSHVRQAGITWIEFSVVASVLAVVAGSLLARLLYYEELAEATVVQMTIQNIRSGLRYQIADRLVAGRTPEIVQLLGANPVSWLERSPDGYVGMVRTGSVRSLPAGSWFYDIDRGEIGYVPKLSFHLEIAPEAEGPAMLRWRMQALRSASPWEIEGLTLVTVSPYQWF
jgi:general secretion pathway protein G